MKLLYLIPFFFSTLCAEELSKEEITAIRQQLESLNNQIKKIKKPDALSITRSEDFLNTEPDHKLRENLDRLAEKIENSAPPDTFVDVIFNEIQKLLSG